MKSYITFGVLHLWMTWGKLILMVTVKLYKSRMQPLCSQLDKTQYSVVGFPIAIQPVQALIDIYGRSCFPTFNNLVSICLFKQQNGLIQPVV